jgi:SAM-dependent methyltransferase
MHASSKIEFCCVIDRYLKQRYRDCLSVLDIGSCDVNGSYVDVIPYRWSYEGADLCEGTNVDIVMKTPFETGEPDCAYDLVITGQCLEHCENPFYLMKEIARLTKPGGLVIATAPASWPEHRYPKDYFRFMPDGMRQIMESAGLKVCETYISEVSKGNTKGQDCWGIAVKL